VTDKIGGQGPREAAAAKNLKRCRKARGWSAQHLADLLADGPAATLTRTAIATVECGQRHISVEELFVLAETFGLSVDEFVMNVCDSCQGAPPPGFACLECGRETKIVLMSCGNTEPIRGEAG
jgi:transcriptional regulator with XRE-family HTH domain